LIDDANACECGEQGALIRRAKFVFGKNTPFISVCGVLRNFVVFARGYSSEVSTLDERVILGMIARK